jgi:hypothetical protein
MPFGWGWSRARKRLSTSPMLQRNSVGQFCGRGTVDAGQKLYFLCVWTALLDIARTVILCENSVGGVSPVSFAWPEVEVEEQRTAALYGSSLFMAGLEASLKAIRGLVVVRIDTTRPDAVIFDLDAPHAQFVVSFLSEHPGLPLVGLGLTSDRVVVLSSQQYTAQTTRDLARVIQIIQPGAAEREPKQVH